MSDLRLYLFLKHHDRPCERIGICGFGWATWFRFGRGKWLASRLMIIRYREPSWSWRWPQHWWFA